MSGKAWDKTRVRGLIGSPEGRVEVKQRLENEMLDVIVLLDLDVDEKKLFDLGKEE